MSSCLCNAARPGRRIDPHIYDWPREDADHEFAELPLLDWRAGPAGVERGAVAGRGLHPLEKRRLVTAHVENGHSVIVSKVPLRRVVAVHGKNRKVGKQQAPIIGHSKSGLILG